MIIYTARNVINGYAKATVFENDEKTVHVRA